MLLCRVCSHPVVNEQRYCTACGWHTGRFVTPADAEIRIPSNVVCERELVFANDGAADLNLSLAIVGTPGVAFVLQHGRSSQVGNRVSPGNGNAWRIGLEFDPAQLDAAAEPILHLECWANDTEPPAGAQVSRQFTNWEPEGKRRRDLAIPIRLEGPGEMWVEQEILMFSDRRVKRDLVIWNKGDSPLRLRRLAAPQGFQVRDNTGMIVTPEQLDCLLIDARATRKFEVIAPTAFPDQKLEVEAEDGTTAEVLLARRTEEEQSEVFPVRYVVGVDFGTHKTAVYFRDLTQPNREPQCIMFEGQETHPSSMLFREPKGYPEFGWIADRLGRTQHVGFLVEAVKLLLSGMTSELDERLLSETARDLEKRLLENVQRTGRDPVELVALYVQHLKGAIDRETNPPEHTTPRRLLVFAVPLLTEAGGGINGTPAAELQVRNTLEAARRAGFRDDLVTETEPRCAAVYLLANRAQYPALHLGDGDIVCVFDSGHGTTDISVVRVRFERGRLRIEPLCHYGVKFAGLHIEQELEGLLKRRYEFEFDADGRAPGGVFDIAGFRQFLRVAKEEVSSEGAAQLGGIRVAEGESPLRLTREDVEAVLAEPLYTIITELIGRMEQVQIEVDGKLTSLTPGYLNWLFLTGGTSRIPYIQQTLVQRLLSNNSSKVVLAKDDDALLAVAKGASLVDYRYDALIPYELSLIIPDGPMSARTVVAKRGSGGMGDKVPINPPPGSCRECHVCIRHGDRDHRVCAFPLDQLDASESCHVEWRVEEDGRLTVWEAGVKKAEYPM